MRSHLFRRSQQPPEQPGNPPTRPAPRPVLDVPPRLAAWASISWRLLVVAAALVVIGIVVSKTQIVIIPVLVAVLLTAIFRPPAEYLRRRGVHALLATWLVFLAAAAIVAAIIGLLVPSIRSEFGSLGHQLTHGVDRVEHWLETGPLHLSRKQVHNDIKSIEHQFTSNRSAIVGGAVSGITLAGEVLGGVLISAFLTFYFVKDGDAMTSWFADLFSEPRRSSLMELGTRIWATVTGYVEGTALNGAVNSFVLSIGLVILGVPLVPVIALLTFIGGFLPLVGAIVSGVIAALVALVAKGPVAAAVVIGLTVLVHNLEGYIVGPLVLGRSVKMHPVAVVLAITIGGTLGGIFGAFVAVPTAAVLLTVNEYYRPTRQGDTVDSKVGLAKLGQPDRRGETAAGSPGTATLADVAPSARGGRAPSPGASGHPRGSEQIPKRPGDAGPEEPRVVDGAGVDVEPHEKA